MAIGNVILELRTERDISQKALAEAIGVGQSTIAQIELNRNEANSATIRKIATFFGVSADYLLELENDYGVKVAAPSESFTREERQLIEDFRQLTYARQKLIKDSIKAMLPTEAESEQKKKGN